MCDEPGRHKKFVILVILGTLTAGLTYYLLNGTDIFKTAPRLLVEAQGPEGQDVELYVDAGAGYFSPDLKASSGAGRDARNRFVLALPDVPIALRARLDLGRSPGTWRIHALVWEGPQYSRRWDALRLDSIFRPLRDVDTIFKEQNTLVIKTAGEDPALEIALTDLPAFWHFIRTPAAWNPPAFWAAALVFVMVFLAGHFNLPSWLARDDNLVWAGLLACFLYLPLVVMLGEPKPEFSEAARRENRRLAPLPHLEWDSLFSLPDRWESYFEDHMGLKGFLAMLDARYKYGLLHSSAKPFEVEPGPHGWLFSRDTSLMRDFLNYETLSQDVMHRLRRNLEYIQMWLSRRGIRFFVFVAHNKHSIYPEQLPRSMRYAGRPSIYEQWKAYMLDSSFVMPIDAGDELRAAAPKVQLFYPYDTHWNFHGGLIAARKLMFYIRRDFPQCPELHDSLFRWVPLDERNADLARKIALQDILHNRETQPSFTVPRAHPLPPPDLPHVSLLQPTLTFSFDDPALPRLLMYRDSYTNLMIPYLSACCSRSTFLWTHALDPLTIMKENPDVVVLEIAEQHIRNLTSLNTAVFEKYQDESGTRP